MKWSRELPGKNSLGKWFVLRMMTSSPTGQMRHERDRVLRLGFHQGELGFENYSTVEPVTPLSYFRPQDDLDEYWFLELPDMPEQHVTDGIPGKKQYSGPCPQQYGDRY